MIRKSHFGYYSLYNFLLTLTSPLWGGLLLVRRLLGKSREGWSERWGRLPEGMIANRQGRPRIWIHAVSAGEVVAAAPIVREIRALLPEYELLLSVTTPAGMEMAVQQVKEFTDQLFYFPFDLPWIAGKVVPQIKPRVFVSLESELWPNILHELKKHRVKTVMVNGRISEKNFQRSRVAASMLFHWMLSNMDRLLMQSEADAARIRTLRGDAQADGQIQVLGNSKFDQNIARLTPAETMALRQSLRFPDDAKVFVAGSTRSPEEEAQLLSAYKEMRESVPELCLLLAPRQINRADEVMAAMKSAGLEPARRTALPELGTVRHLVLDTMGELANVYAVADITFVGNSFEPVVKGGGQNLLQPLAHGKPVFFGPRHATIRSEAALVTEAGVGFCVENGHALAEAGISLLRNEAKRAEIGRRAMELIASQQGASRRYALAVKELAMAASP